jgi:hypothetical protein
MPRQHTLRPERPARGQPVIERKIKPDGTVRDYACTLLSLDRGLAVVEFVMSRGGAIFDTPIQVPPGSVSHGYFWARRPYNLYRMHDPGGRLIAHRFDAVADVRLGADVVSYRDLVLDWWVTRDDVIIEEDRDEFETLSAAGSLTARDIAVANAASYQVLSRYRHIIDEAAALERRLGLFPPLTPGH